MRDALTSGAEFKGASESSVIEIINILMQCLKKIKFDAEKFRDGKKNQVLNKVRIGIMDSPIASAPVWLDSALSLTLSLFKILVFFSHEFFGLILILSLVLSFLPLPENLYLRQEPHSPHPSPKPDCHLKQLENQTECMKQ